MLFDTRSKADSPEFYEKMALGQAQNLMAKIMKEKEVSKTELASRLGKGKSAITRLLSDGRNLTMRSFGRILHALGVEPQFDWAEIKGNKYATGEKPREAEVVYLPYGPLDVSTWASMEIETASIFSESEAEKNSPDLAA